jgi:D-inositol-3-phosphate glycosyltransferase
MSAGLPVIGSDWNGYKETIEHGKTGFLVPAYWADCVDSVSRAVMLKDTMEVHRKLAEAVSIDLKSLTYYIDLLLKKPSLRQEMGEAARERVIKYYNWPIIVKAYEELWAGLTEQARHRSADEEFRYGIDAYDHLSVFRHFATGVITKDRRLQITSMGRECLDKTLNIRMLNSTELVGDWQKLAEILRICGSEESVVVTDLIQKAGGENEHVNNEVFRQAARLIKYGLLEVC